jgi:hypothetical protein
LLNFSGEGVLFLVPAGDAEEFSKLLIELYRQEGFYQDVVEGTEEGLERRGSCDYDGA